MKQELEYGFGDAVRCGDAEKGFVDGIITGLSKESLAKFLGSTNIWYNVEVRNTYKNAKYKYILSAFPVSRIVVRRTVIVEKVKCATLSSKA